MTRQPRTLVLHTVRGYYGDESTAELVDEIENRLPDIRLEMADTPKESRDTIPEADIVLTSAAFTTDLLDRGDRLAWVQNLGTGVDAFDLDRFEERGVVLTSSSGVPNEPIAEQVLGFMLVFECKINRGIRQQQRKVWERYRNGELRGRTLGIVGVGEIGGRIAELADLLDMEVLGVKRNPETVVDAVDEVFGPGDLQTVLARSDYVVVACRLTEETRGMVGAEELLAMKRSGVIINIARGEIIDEEALVTELQQGRIGGAALDVFETEPLPRDSPLWDLSNVVITPHMSGKGRTRWGRSADVFAENYERFTASETEAMVNRHA